MSCFHLFFIFVKIGMFTIGGGFPVIPLIEREIVDRGMLDRNDFMDLFVISQSLPGVFAVNIAVFVGYRLKGFKGGFLCALATILPAFIVMLVIAAFFAQDRDNPWAVTVFNGLRPAVVALIAVPCITAAKALGLRWRQLALPMLATLLIWLAGVSPVWIVLAGLAMQMCIVTHRLGSAKRSEK